jgi:hypothetical protein
MSPFAAILNVPNGAMRWSTRSFPDLLKVIDRGQRLATILATATFVASEGIGQRYWERWIGRAGSPDLLNQLGDLTLLFGGISIILGIAAAMLFQNTWRNMVLLLIAFLWCILQPIYFKA